MSYDAYKTRSDRDEYTEVVTIATCAAPGCHKAGVAQVVGLSETDCPFCGFSWDTEASQVCSTCGKVSTLTAETDRTRCPACGVGW